MIRCMYNGDTDISNYITKVTWSGDDGQAARKLEFSIAYNPKDQMFNSLNLENGKYIEFSYDDYPLFKGRITDRKRSSSSYTYDLVAFDDMIFLARSKISKLFDKVTVTDAIKQVCNEIGIPVAKDILLIQTVVTFFAENMSCTEIFEKLFQLAKADLKKKYAIVYVNNAVNIVERGTLIEDYIATDTINVMSSDHSASTGEMVNRVKMVDAKGTVKMVLNNDDDINAYGVYQEVYKIEPPRKGQPDNLSQAKALLKSVTYQSSLEAIGNVQCITGYSVTVQEEQLQGDFYIKSDTHNFENNNHTMSLTLEYIEGSERNARN